MCQSKEWIEVLYTLSHLILTTDLWVRYYFHALVFRERKCLAKECPVSLDPIANISPFKVKKKFWGSSIQNSEPYCCILKTPKWVDLKCYHHIHTKKVRMWGDRGIKEPYYGNHFALYIWIKSSHFTPKIYITLCANYISIKMKKW